MFQVNDLVMYAVHGVCRVEAIGPVLFSGKPTEKDYYTLRPVFETGGTTIYVPVESGGAIRAVTDPDAVRAILDELPRAEVPVLAHRNARLLTSQYAEIIHSYDLRRLLQLMKSVRSKELAGQKLGATDRKFYAKAETLVRCEIAAALKLSPEAAGTLVEKTLSA